MTNSKNKLLPRVLRVLGPLRKKSLTQEGSEKIVHGFNKKVKLVGGMTSFISKLRVCYNYFRSPNTSKVKKSFVGAALLYFIIPTDVIADWIPVVGYLDDLTATLFIWKILAKELEKFESKGE
ncbi:YkvA family protein [Hazenella coriacea]|uniref:Uncharacterized membrane protein YkvA (DUF1232 family) n=1 Tax=Hazenella coriacea TaxID=1179467 RepID=A0A4R3L5D8_9BACL|nr:YkvA family protein [Hazenella coriacea]TCS95011.1 uncharacterized membrane protein YkvA (DUF1232 family) [Hazenella coriacea]